MVKAGKPKAAGGPLHAPLPRRWLPLILCLLSAFCFLPAVYGAAPPLTCHITEIAPRSRSLHVSCALSASMPGKWELRFADQFAGLTRLSERIFALKVRDSGGAALPLEIRGDGRYFLTLSGREPQLTISYDLRLARALDPAQYALASSLGPEAGFLMLADALPQVCAEAESGCGEAANPVRLQMHAPDGWQVATTEERRGEFFEITDPQRAVFFLGRLREQEVSAGEMKLRVMTAGAWSFADDRAARLAEAIAREQAALIGSREQGDFLVTLAPFPLPLTGLRSSALTRGRTVVLLLNAADDPARTLAHYQRHLAHELFHFYLPNAFRVRENFDWFWEGFTRYIALTTLLRQRLLTLRDYLDALGEEYEAYAANPLRARLSLIAASPDKFAGPASYELVYRKGMLVAALYDLELRWQSGGRRSLMDVMRALYQDYARSGREIGNREVLAELGKAGDSEGSNSSSTFARFIRDYIEGTREIDLAASIAPYGLVIERNAASRGRPRVGVAKKLSERQKALLAQLGSPF
jgi:predicted metalloprotease with PDZ domain